MKNYVSNLQLIVNKNIPNSFYYIIIKQNLPRNYSKLNLNGKEM